MKAQIFIAPKPYGGNLALKGLFIQELTYPEKAFKTNTEGTVEIVFTVTATGVTKNLQVLFPLEPECDQEALRLAALVRWHPAERGGLPVTSEHFLKVKFDKRKYKKYQKIRAERKPLVGLPPASSDQVLWEPAALDTLPEPMIDKGMKGLSKYFHKNMKYPGEAFKHNVQGTVVLEFVVEKSGSATNMEAVKPLGGGCGEEAYRLVKEHSMDPCDQEWPIGTYTYACAY